MSRQSIIDALKIPSGSISGILNRGRSQSMLMLVNPATGDAEPAFTDSFGGGGGGTTNVDFTATNSRLDTLTAKFPTALGQLTKTASLSVTPASDAPGVALATPAFHKVTDGTNAAAVKAASTAPAATDPALVVTMSPNSVQAKFRAVGTTAPVIVGTTAQNALAANTSRSYLFVQNNSTADIWVNFSGTATVGTGIKLTAGQAYENPPHFVPTGAVSLIGASAGLAATAVEA